MINPFRRLRFSLRTLFVVVTIACVWIGGGVHRVVQQRRAVETITTHQGRVLYRHQHASGVKGNGPAEEPPAPVWLRRLLGDDYFRHVSAVVFSSHAATGLSDQEWQLVGSLPSLEAVLVSNAQMPENTLRHFRRATGMKVLSLAGTSFTDDDLRIVGRFRQLVSLKLVSQPQRSAITDAGLAELTNLRNLEELDLLGTRITDAGLVHLQGLTKLKTLALEYSDVTDEGMVELTALPVREVQLAQTAVSERGAAILAANPTVIQVGGVRLESDTRTMLNDRQLKLREQLQSAKQPGAKRPPFNASKKLKMELQYLER